MKIWNEDRTQAVNGAHVISLEITDGGGWYEVSAHLTTGDAMPLRTFNRPEEAQEFINNVSLS